MEDLFRSQGRAIGFVAILLVGGFVFSLVFYRRMRASRARFARQAAQHGLRYFPEDPFGLERLSMPLFEEADTRRRALAVAALAGLRPAHLRAAARALAEEARTRPRDVPVTALAAALGATRPVAEAVAAVTPGYFGGVQIGQSGVDDAVRELVEAFGGEATEATAARIGLLVQAHDATGGLVTNVILDVAAANRDPEVFADPDRFDPRRPRLDHALTFGAGPRACPGRDHALALAAGTVEGAGSCG